MTTPTRVQDVIRRGAGLLARRGLGPARLEAELLAAHVLAVPRWRLFLEPERQVAPTARAVIWELFTRRAAGEPLQYLTESREFWGLTFQVRPGVFIPRPETEGVIVAALRSLVPAGYRDAPLLIVDIGTGSGCLAVALALTYPQARVVASDLSPVSLTVAVENARRHGVMGRVTFVLGDLFEPLDPDVKADLIVSNPPYVTTEAWGRLPREIRLHEPRLALDGGQDGLGVIRRLLTGAARYLRPNGLLLLEIGRGQDVVVSRLAQMNGFSVECVEPDLAGIPRVLVARATGWTA